MDAGTRTPGIAMLVAVNTLLGKNRAETGHEDRYLRRMLEAASKVQADTEFVLLTHEGNHALFAPWERVQVEEGAGMLRSLRSGSPVERAAKQAKADLLLTPLDAASPNPPMRQVLYALDLAPWESEPLHAVRKSGDAKAIKKACAVARAVVAPSEYLRRKCLELFEIPLDRVVVALPGVSPVFQESHETMVDLPYIVVMTDALTGSSMPRVREALDQLAKEYPHTFVIVGRSGEPEPEDWGPRVVRIEQLPDNHLTGLYQHSEVFLYPALHDGSALRILEALTAGVPVVAANSGAAPELAGKHPFYYNPASTATIVQNVRRALDEDKKTQRERIRLGQNATSKYTWEKCAWRFLTAFKRV